MNNKDKALRLAAVYLLAVAHGAECKPEDAKAISDVCFIALPMKYRLTREQLNKIKGKGNEQKEKHASKTRVN